MYKLLRDKKTKRRKELVINYLGVIKDNKGLNDTTIKIVGIRVYKHSLFKSGKIVIDVDVSGTIRVYGDQIDVKDASRSARKKNSRIRSFFIIKSISDRLSYVYGIEYCVNIEIGKIKYV